MLFGTPVGGVVAFQPDQRQSTWIVFQVTDRRTDAPFDQQAVSAISSTQKVTIGERLLQPDAERLGVGSTRATACGTRSAAGGGRRDAAG